MPFPLTWTRPMLSYLARVQGLWRCRATVLGKADALITVYGEFAYWEARAIARRERAGRRQREFRFWSQVALEIAQRQGREVGVTGADQYPGVY